ncbi:hypothetical protein ACOME3_002628 [Neoechinorhynchus agilis]
MPMGKQTLLLSNNHGLRSERGVQQGDPFSSIAFSLSVNPVAHSLKSSFKGWYLADATLEGNPSVALCNLETLVKERPKIVIELKSAKCYILVMNVNYRGRFSEPGYRNRIDHSRPVESSRKLHFWF